MKRIIDKKLLEWKNRSRRKPLILTGARQVGKTYALKRLGETFDSVASVDLEKNPGWCKVFEEDLSAQRICSDLEILLSQKIRPGKTLLFFDEIQACPRAIMAMRYFFEEMPDLHVAAAGSLLEFTLGNISFPVGRIQLLNMHPLCFSEYLQAIGNDEAARLIQKTPGPLSQSVHDYLCRELRLYFFIGGMPESVKAYVDTRSPQESFEVQAEICETYRLDFAKYNPKVDKLCLNNVLTSVARNIGGQIKYARLAEGFSNPTLKKAFDLLCQAEVIRKIPAADPSGLPLGVSASSKIFKALLVDIGLMRYLNGMPVEVEYDKTSLLDTYRGSLAEQFVGQELVISQKGKLHYWSRRARGSSAEVDYLAVMNGKICPIEVKSGSAGRMKSLHLFLQANKETPRGIVFSERPYAELPEQRLVFVPLYFAGTTSFVAEF